MLILDKEVKAWTQLGWRWLDFVRLRAGTQNMRSCRTSRHGKVCAARGNRIVEIRK